MGKQRERNRVKSRIDELPQEIIDLINKRLNDVNITYKEISEEVIAKGYDISKSSIGRYALRKNAAAMRLKEAYETTRLLVDTVRENNDIEATEAATTILINELTKKFATAQEEFENMPLDKAGRLLVAIQRSAVFKERFKLEYRKGVNDAVSRIKDELKRELSQHPELYERMCKLADDVAARIDGGQDA